MRAYWKERVAFFAGAVRRAIDTGDFRRDVDPDQLAFEADGILIAYHFASRLLDDPKASDRAHRAFEALVADARARR